MFCRIITIYHRKLLFHWRYVVTPRNRKLINKLCYSQKICSARRKTQEGRIWRILEENCFRKEKRLVKNDVTIKKEKFSSGWDKQKKQYYKSKRKPSQKKYSAELKAVYSIDEQSVDDIRVWRENLSSAKKLLMHSDWQKKYSKLLCSFIIVGMHIPQQEEWVS